MVPRQLLGGARVGRCHGLREELALVCPHGEGLAFAMGTHERLGALQWVVEACGSEGRGRAGRGVSAADGGRRTSAEI